MRWRGDQSGPAHATSTLYFRTLLLLFISLAAVLIVGGLLQVEFMDRLATSQVTRSLLSLARVMAPLLKEVPTGDVSRLARDVESLSKRGECRVTVIDREGTVLADSESHPVGEPHLENHAHRPEVQAAMSGEVGSSVRDSTTLGYPMMYVAIPFSAGEGGERAASPRPPMVAGRTSSQPGAPAVLRVSVPLTVVTQLRARIRQVLLFSLVAGLLPVLALGAWLARRVSRPLDHLTRAASAGATADFGLPPGEPVLREVEALGRALSEMAASARDGMIRITRERNRLTAILESMSEGVMGIDQRGVIVWHNESARVLLDLPSDRVSGRSLFEVVRLPQVTDLARAVLAGEGTDGCDIEANPPRDRTLRVQAVACEGLADEPRAVLVVRDVTQHHRYDELRRQFVANVSHELKSPLTSIRSLTEALLQGGLEDPEVNRRFVALVEEDAVRLGRLIDDLLSLSSLESGATPLRRVATSLRALVEDVVATLEPAIAARSLEVVIEVPDELEVYADPDRLRQVLLNLVENAVKYNRPGGSVRVQAQEGLEVAVAVQDTGIGIPASDIPRLFERFYRVDKTRSREMGGTGLGLSIVKHIVEGHGGHIQVESRPGQGSVFRFTLPARVRVGDSPGPAPPPQ